MEVADFVTPLDFQLDPDQERKFLSLKELYGKKVKSLIASLDAKEKELTKLKVMNKDNRRTQMIQALRTKSKELELVIDVCKEELARKCEMSLEEVAQMIVRKTLGGPKRFRPLSREELELKIIDLEKKVKRLTNQATNISSKNDEALELKSNSSRSRRPPGSSSSTMEQFASQSEKKDNNGSMRSEDKDIDAREIDPDDIQRFSDLIEENFSLKSTLEARNIVIEKQNIEIANLRARNAQLVVEEDREEVFLRETQEFQKLRDFYMQEIDELTRRLASCMEENMQLRSESTIALEDQKAEFETVQDHCQRLLKQNSTLLEQVAELEQEIESNYGRFPLNRVNSTSTISPTNMDATINGSHNASFTSTGGLSGCSSSSLPALKAAQQSNAKMQVVLKQLEEKNLTLTLEVSQLRPLRDQLREKNIEIKELRRNLEDEKKRVAKLSASTGKSLTAVESNDDQLATLLQENRRYREAFSAAINIDKDAEKPRDSNRIQGGDSFASSAAGEKSGNKKLVSFSRRDEKK